MLAVHFRASCLISALTLIRSVPQLQEVRRPHPRRRWKSRQPGGRVGDLHLAGGGAPERSHGIENLLVLRNW